MTWEKQGLMSGVLARAGQLPREATQGPRAESPHSGHPSSPREKKAKKGGPVPIHLDPSLKVPGPSQPFALVDNLTIT